MRQIHLPIALLTITLSLPANALGLGDLVKHGEKLLGKPAASSSSTQTTGLDSITLSEGLKEALKIGGERAISRLAADGGFLNSADVRIPLPGFLNTAANTLRRFGLSSKVDAFDKSMNSAAEQAISEATPLFVNTLENLTLEDAKAIYTGGDTAATDYFRNKTSQQLKQRMRPLIDKAITSAGVTRYYDALMQQAVGKLPMLGSQTPDLSTHITDAALKGLFLRLGQEERQIRQNPVARSTDLLKKVFAN